MSAVSTAVAPKFRTIPNNQLRIPTGGFRTETLRDQKIIAHIEAKPGLTCREYADQMDIMAFEVNSTIFQTRQGRQLAERGLIRIPTRGAIPRWSKLCINQTALIKRMRENQYEIGTIEGIEDGAIYGKSILQMEQARRFQMTSSPRKRRELIEGTDRMTAEVAVAFSTLKISVATMIERVSKEAATNAIALYEATHGLNDGVPSAVAGTIEVPAESLEIRGPSPAN